MTVGDHLPRLFRRAGETLSVYHGLETAIELGLHL